MALPIKYIHQVDEKPIYCDHEEVIEALAELAGFNVYEVKGFNDEHEGYIIEPQDKDLREFLGKPCDPIDIEESEFIEKGEKAYYEIGTAIYGDDF